MRELNSSEEHEALLQDVVGPIYDAMIADPSRGIPAEAVDRLCEQWDEEDGIVESSSLSVLHDAKAGLFARGGSDSPSSP